MIEAILFLILLFALTVKEQFKPRYYPEYTHPSFKPVQHTIITAAMWAPFDKPYLGQRIRTKPNRHDRKRYAKYHQLNDS